MTAVWSYSLSYFVVHFDFPNLFEIWQIHENEILSLFDEKSQACFDYRVLCIDGEYEILKDGEVIYSRKADREIILEYC